jgi:putative tryptophan/tyrosine transport system substrate-binding protein
MRVATSSSTRRLGGAAAWPLVARAQQPKLPMVGLLNGVSFEGPYTVPVAAIRQGLQEAGFVEGRNLAIEYRTADGEPLILFAAKWR